MQAGVVGLLKGSQVARFALPAPDSSSSTAPSSATAVPAQKSSSAESSSAPAQNPHPTSPQPPPAGPPTASQPPPATTPKDPTSTPPSQHDAASTPAATPASLASTSGQQSRDPHLDPHNASTASTQTASRGQARASTSGTPPPQAKDAASSEQAPIEAQPTGSQGADQAGKADSIGPTSSMVQPQIQLSPPHRAAADQASAEAVTAAAASSVYLGDSGKTATAPQQRQSQRLVTQPEDQSGSDAAGSPARGSEGPQHEAAGAKPGTASRPPVPDRDPAQNAQEAEQPLAESSESGAGPASQQQQAQRHQEAHADVHEGSHAGVHAAEVSISTDTDARVDSSLVAEDSAEDKQELAPTGGTVTGAGCSGEETREEDSTSLNEDGSPAAGSASNLASDDRARPDESQHAQQAGPSGQQQVQRVPEQAADVLLQSSARRTDRDAILLPGEEQRTSSVTPPVVAHENHGISNPSMLQASPTVEVPPSGAATKQTQRQVAATEGPSASSSSAVGSTINRRAAAASAPSGGDSLRPPASTENEGQRGTAPALPGTEVSTVSSGAPSEAASSHATSSSAPGRDANTHLNESQKKETDAQVLSPKGSLKSRQTVEMKRQQTSFNPLG